MYVSLKYRFLFYRIPKTASTSMVRALKPYFTNFSKSVWVAKLDGPALQDAGIRYSPTGWVSISPHYTPSESLHLLSNMNIPITNKFKMLTVVRNPYTRILSMYNAFCNGLATININTLDYFLDLLEAKNNNDDYAISLLGPTGHTYDKQTIWTHDPKIFNMKIMKYEELNTDAIIEYLNIPSFSLLRENPSSIPADQNNLQPHQKKKIYSMYQDEFDIYCYQK